jgi:hypothetical protein
MAKTAWSRLTKAGQTRLRKSGVNPASYNAYEKKSKADKAKTNRNDFIRGKTPQQQKDKARKTKRKTKRGDAVDRMVSILRGRGKRANRKHIGKYVGSMDSDDLDWLMGDEATYSGIAQRASQPPDPDTGVNPFWYG